ncbi:MAG: tetratricopeptide repeat protein [Flavobacterium stagni]
MLAMVFPKKIIVYLCFLFTGTALIGQTQENLANSLYQEKDFTKASVLYEELISQQPQNELFHHRYIQCLVQTSQFDKASKYLRKKIKKSDPNALSLIIDDCWVAARAGDSQKEVKIMELILEKLKQNAAMSYFQDPSPYLYAANLFERYDLRKQAIQVLESAENNLGNHPDIANQLATLHMASGNRIKGIQLYVDMLTGGRVPFNAIKQALETQLADSADYVALQNILLQQIQAFPENNELTIALNYTFIKQANWAKAFVFAKALDRRLKQKGERVFELANLCISNKVYDVAEQCLNYCIAENSENSDLDNRLWHKSWIKLGEIGYLKYLQQGKKSDAAAVISTLKKIEHQFGPSEETLDNAINLSRLLVQNDSAGVSMKSAESLLRNYLENAGIRNKQKLAKIKIELADVLVAQNDVWTSELLYAQVEKDFKEEETGQLAKFKRAELSFYRGDFDWATMQLNVLKGATTQLISNNAMELALTIIDNYGMDSNFAALHWFGQALLAERQLRYKDAYLFLDSITTNFPGHSLSDDILFVKARIKIALTDYIEAVNLLETLAVAYSFDILADNAWYQLGNLYEFRLNNPEKAMSCYQTILEKYSSSVFLVDARREFRRLRGDKNN